MHYTLHTVAVALRDPELEREDELDLWGALSTLPYPDQAIIRLYAQGYSQAEAVRKLQLSVNPNRTFVRGLVRLRDILNGNSVPNKKGV